MQKILITRMTLLILLLMWFAHPAHAFELILMPTETEKKLALKKYGITFRAQFAAAEGVAHAYADPVHEGLTHLAYECPMTLSECASANMDTAPFHVIAGVRWNDDPPFQFTATQGKYLLCEKFKSHVISYSLAFPCWLKHFQMSKEQANKPPPGFLGFDASNGTLLSRSHFGDLQFLHTMASKANLPALDTKNKILMWAEFTWRVHSNLPADYIPHTTLMGQVPVTGLVEHFPKKEDRTVTDLFTQGRPWFRLELGQLAFGSLLHMVQDSFSSAHVHRRDIVDAVCPVPEIVTFFTYAGQDTNGHKERDGLTPASQKTELPSASVIVVQKELLRMSRSVPQTSWEQVRLYLDTCVFRLSIDSTPSTAGLAD